MCFRKEFSAIALAAFFLFSNYSFADVILLSKGKQSITVSHSESGHWKKYKYVCVLRNGEKIGCGKVTEMTDDGVKVYLGPIAMEVVPGDVIRTYRFIDWGKFAIFTLGLDAGLGYYYPHLHLQFKIKERLYLGAKGVFSRSTEQGNRVTNYGFGLTINHYAEEKPFPGFWLQGGVGAYFLSLTPPSGVKESGTAPFIFATVGWRGYIAEALTFGVGVGAQYLPNRIQGEKLGLRNFEPLVVIDFGVRF